MLVKVADDPKAVGKALATVEDPVEQVLLVRLAHEHSPNGLVQICRALKGQPAQPDCDRLRDRAHLSITPEQREEVSVDLQPRRGMLLDRIRMDPLPTDRLGGEAVDVCEGEQLHSRCQSNAAVELARAGDHDGAWARCLAIEAGAERDECSFRSAEELVKEDMNRPGQPERVRPAMELCLASVSYQGQCLTHVTQNMGRWAPMRVQDSAAAWARVEAGKMEAVALIEELRPGTGEPLAERLYAEAAWNAVARLDPLVAVPLEGLPDGAVSHLRGAAALGMMYGRPDGDLDELSASLEALLKAVPEAGSESNRPPGPAKVEPQVDLWADDHASEADLPSVPFAGRVRRTRSDDPAVDRLIVLMESAAQASPPMLGVIAGGLEHEDAKVRWTAVRLMSCVNRNFDGAPFADDPHPAVQHRATTECASGGPGSMPGADRGPGGAGVPEGVRGSGVRGPGGPGGGPRGGGRGPGRRGKAGPR